MKSDYRLVFTQRMSAFRSWIGSRDPQRFRLLLLAVLALGLGSIVASDYLPGRYHFETQGTLSLQIVVAILLMVLLELLVLAVLLQRFAREALDNNNLLLVVAFLLLLFAAFSRVLVVPPLSPYLIPTAALAMITAMIINGRTGLLLVLLQSLNIGLMTEFHLEYTLVALITGAFSLYVVTRLSQRSQLFLASLTVTVVAAASIFASELFREVAVATALRQSLWSIWNGVLSLVLTLSLLTVLEWVFNLTTPLRLLELANPSQPLLRRLMQVAPGTYNHSIQLGNLAEVAAEAIDADPLLARVGAYYHDIGKVVRPEYFIENQLHVRNPHDRLNPNLSKLAITAHVRDGEDLARQYNLPDPIIDIIRQHHGTSVVTYFFYKAMESSDDGIEEEDYRYEEEKPRSREAAIIMLADSVEAAAKAMKNPTVKKLQGLIHEVFKQKMDDGQLDCSDLTLGDLHKIHTVFETGLRGLVGHRIEYSSGPQDHARTDLDGRLAAAETTSDEAQLLEDNGPPPTIADNGAPAPRPRLRTVHRPGNGKLPGAPPPRTGHRSKHPQDKS